MGTKLEAAYGRWITVEGPTYWERQRGRVQCRECKEEMAEGSLAGHKMTQHGQAAEARRRWKTSYTEEESQTYHVAFPAKGGPQRCLVEGCPGQAATRMVMWVHSCTGMSWTP